MRALKQWLPAVLWAAVILSSSNDAFSADRSGEWLELVFGPGVPEWANFLFRKSTHVVVYAILAALTWRGSRRPATVLALCLAVAGVDEWRQSAAAHRTGTAWDVLLDLAGAGVGVYLVRWWSNRTHRTDRTDR